MGGEPTFVSVDDLEAPEWNIAAVGPTKRALADDLIRKLRARFAPGGLLHYGQGKWYPGESLPRWAFGLYWRKDGVPIWKNADLIARIENPRKAEIKDAERFAEGTAQKLGLAPDYVLPAFEDPAHWLQKEAALPANVDPTDPKLSDPEERSRMARVFDSGLNTPKGFVLPIQRWNAIASRHPGRWRSEHWKIRRSNLFLTPGDSPLGLRLPIASLEYVPPEEYPYIIEQDPMAPRGELARRRQAAGGTCRERGQGKVKTGAGAHRDVDRNPRRRALRLHAAGREGRGLSRAYRRGRGDRRRAADPGACRGLRAAVTIRASRSSRSRPIPA